MTRELRDPSAEWNAVASHRVSSPQVTWNRGVLENLPLFETETVIDAGCGTGRLTTVLLERLPHSRVFALDRSSNMLAEAADCLSARFSSLGSCLHADVQHLQLTEPTGAIFSTATTHLVLDHPQPVRALLDCLKSGGRLVAQCSGGSDIAHLQLRGEEFLPSEEYRKVADGWTDPWKFTTRRRTAPRLAGAGFTAIESSLEPAATTWPSASEYQEVVRWVARRAHLDAQPDAISLDAFMSNITALSTRDERAFTFDYCRLNLAAARSGSP